MAQVITMPDVRQNVVLHLNCAGCEEPIAVIAICGIPPAGPHFCADCGRARKAAVEGYYRAVNMEKAMKARSIESQREDAAAVRGIIWGSIFSSLFWAMLILWAVTR